MTYEEIQLALINNGAAAVADRLEIAALSEGHLLAGDGYKADHRRRVTKTFVREQQRDARMEYAVMITDYIVHPRPITPQEVLDLRRPRNRRAPIAWAVAMEVRRVLGYGQPGLANAPPPITCPSSACTHRHCDRCTTPLIEGKIVRVRYAEMNTEGELCIGCTPWAESTRPRAL
jgi:hypothetical protein